MYLFHQLVLPLQSIMAAVAFFYSNYLLLHWQLLILVMAGFLGSITFFMAEWQAQSIRRESDYDSIWSVFGENKETLDDDDNDEEHIADNHWASSGFSQTRLVCTKAQLWLSLYHHSQYLSTRVRIYCVRPRHTSLILPSSYIFEIKLNKCTSDRLDQHDG